MSDSPHIVSLDIGSSSVRALLFDAGARQVEGYGSQLTYRIARTPDGGAEVDAEELSELVIDCLDDLHRQVEGSGLKIAGVAGSAFWHSFLGVDEAGKPTLPILHLLDTRSVDQVARVADTHARTGCMPHSSYWPARLLWLAEHRAEQVAATARWLSFPEYLFEKLFGRAPGGAAQGFASWVSTSMISATGLWDQNKSDYDELALRDLPVERSQLASHEPALLDRPANDLLPEYERMWPLFEHTRWFPLLGDGACNNLGSGCTRPERLSLMVGTTGAMRLTIPRSAARSSIEIPKGLWCYRADAQRWVIGGALSNGGEVYAWTRRTLQLPKDLEARLEAAQPGGHHLKMLPFFSGERTPYWRADLRAAILDLSFATGPFEIFHAALESVTLSFRQMYRLIAGRCGTPAEIVASGGALLHSPGWTQMMADALGHPVTTCTETEPSCRGAALWALERLGIIDNLESLPASTGRVLEPRAGHRDAYDQLAAERDALYEKLFGSRE